MLKLILPILILLIGCSTIVAQDNIVNVYNGYRGYGYGDYGRSYGSTNIIIPNYYVPFWGGPTYSYAVYHSYGRPARLQWARYVHGIDIAEKYNARYRNRARISNMTGYDPGGPTMYDVEEK